MFQQLPVMIVIAPLVTSFLVFVTGWWRKKPAYFLALAVLCFCLTAAVSVLISVLNHGPVSYWLGGWKPPWGIEYRIDHLNALMLVLVSFLGLLAAFHAEKSVERELPRKTTLFWSLFLLLLTGLLGICITGDLFNLFVLLEVTSLSGYALIAMGEKRSLYAGFRYVVIGTIGASFYLLGVGYLYLVSGSLNIADLAQRLPALYQSRIVLAGFAFIAAGLSIKMALFPLHTWLPDAYTYAPSAVSAVIAPLMTKVMAYALIRVMFTVFDVSFMTSVLNATHIMVWFGAIAILFGGVMALSQNDYKRMLAYVIIAEMGYIVGGIGVANTLAFRGAVFHLLNDAMMMACLFMVAGHVMYTTGGHRISDFRGIFRKMPITAAVFTVGALAVIGVPPTCGFFSKWYLLLGGIKAHQWGFVTALLVCTLLNIALFFRVFDQGLFVHDPEQVPAGSKTEVPPREGEAPFTMLLPACILAVVIMLTGIFNQKIIDGVIRFTVPPGF